MTQCDFHFSKGGIPLPAKFQAYPDKTKKAMVGYACEYCKPILIALDFELIQIAGEEVKP